MLVGGRASGGFAPHFGGLGVVLVVLSSCSSSEAETSPGPKKLVVVVYPNESDGAPGVFLVDRALRSTFAGESPGLIEVRNEYVDTSRLWDAGFRHAQVELLRRKYADRQVDLVVAGLSSGLDFVLEHRDELFPGVPVVYTCVEQREVVTRKLPPDVVGVPVRMDLTGTLDLVLALHPDARRVFVIAGAAPFDLYWEAEARRAFRAYEERLEFVYLTGLPMDDLLGRVAGLPEQSVIYYLHVFQDGAGNPTTPAEALDRVAAAAAAPIYGHVDTYVRRGVVGGRVFSFETEGRNAAHLGRRILAGEKPGAIPIPGASETTPLFDWRQLRRWGVGEQALPAGSVVRYREASVWERYGWEIIGGVSLCAVEAILIVGLLVLWVKRRRAEERFRQVVETAPTGVILVGRGGAIDMVNAQVERLFGYRREELLGRAVELLVPQLARDRYRGEYERESAPPADRPTGPGQNLLGRRKDGGEFPVEIDLSPLRTARGVFVMVSVIDLTDRRRAEDGLRASQQELQQLPGRLLEAQELERRRIARELHDDVNQTLALLAVEMDILERDLTGPGCRAVERVCGLSARVKQLSSAVHDLSHQLHPSKLEHLGLVAAIQGLCQDLDRYHGLAVEFTHADVPKAMPEATGLCLYRVAQEALRNVVKHSGADRAVVELHGTADGLRLRVGDGGTGFDPASALNGGLGLVSMRERLLLVGGKITINSRPGGGTRVDIHVPPPGRPTGSPGAGPPGG